MVESPQPTKMKIAQMYSPFRIAWMNIQIWKAKMTRLSGEVNSEASPLADNKLSSDADMRRMLLKPKAHDNPGKSGRGQPHSKTLLRLIGMRYIRQAVE